MKGSFVRLSVRQLVYMALIVALLAPLSMLSQPASGERQGGSAGGQLAQLRSKFKLGDTNVGAIDPRSETIRLVSLGLGGIANVILWTQADESKEKEDWTSYRAVLDNLIHLQPYYPIVWEHQAWNLSYNISAEFDDYHDKYYWVMDGIRFLQRGTTYLENSPRLLHRTGWFVTHKIGRSDERVQYRRLFAQDDDFHREQSVQERDNWLFGRAYYRLANDAVDLGGAQLNFIEPMIFYSDRVRAQMFSAEALAADYVIRLEAEANRTTDGEERRRRVAELDEDILRQVRGRWSVAEAEMLEFGKRPFVADDGTLYRLGESEAAERTRKEWFDKLEAIEPGLRERLREKKRATLTDAEKSALKVDAKVRNEQQARLAVDAENKLRVSDDEVADNVAEAKRAEAREIAKELTQASDQVFRIERGRHLVHYDYWLSRCKMEQEEFARNAYRHMAQGAIALKVDTDLLAARREFEAGFKLWRQVLDKYPDMLGDQTAFAIEDYIEGYRQLLRQLDEPFPRPFILDDMLQAMQ